MLNFNGVNLTEDTQNLQEVHATQVQNNVVTC